MRSRRVTPERIAAAMEDDEVETMADLCRRLGVFPGGGNYGLVRDVAARSGLAVPEPGRRRRLRGEEEARLAQLIADSRSHSEVLRALGRRADGCDWHAYRASVLALQLDDSHLGEGWRKGGQRPPTEQERAEYVARLERGDVGRTGLGPRLIRTA